MPPAPYAVQYIVANHLQSADDPTVVQANEALAALFGEKSFKMHTIAHKLQAHISAPAPLIFSHTVRWARREQGWMRRVWDGKASVCSVEVVIWCARSTVTQVRR